MADDKTTVTEFATALGCLDFGTASWAVLQRPAELLVGDDAWCQLERGLHDAELLALADTAFANGAAFAAHPEALGGRRPNRIEWTGARRPPGAARAHKRLATITGRLPSDHQPNPATNPPSAGRCHAPHHPENSLLTSPS